MLSPHILSMEMIERASGSREASITNEIFTAERTKGTNKMRCLQKSALLFYVDLRQDPILADMGAYGIGHCCAFLRIPCYGVEFLMVVK